MMMLIWLMLWRETFCYCGLDNVYFVELFVCFVLRKGSSYSDANAFRKCEILFW
jgi:hypothetical protein